VGLNLVNLLPNWKSVIREKPERRVRETEVNHRGIVFYLSCSPLEKIRRPDFLSFKLSERAKEREKTIGLKSFRFASAER
jgi:hypothetical protein